MGNQNSQPSNDFQKRFQQLQEQMKYQQQRSNIDLHKLQQQIYHTQLKMQEMKQRPQQYQQPPQQQQRPQQQYQQQQRPQQQSQYHQPSLPPQIQIQNQYQQQHRPPQIQNQYQQRPSQQQLQIQQPPQQQIQMDNKINSLLSSPELKKEMSNNPAFGVQMIELILKEFGTQLTDQQYNKINDYLERANQQTYQQQNHHQKQIMIHNVDNEEEIERHKFEEEQLRRRREFEEQQKRRKAEYQRQLKSFESNNTTNPYQLLGLTQNYNMDQLKVAYRKKAIMTHPDKGGNPELFDEVTKAYFSLLEKLKNKEDDKQYMDLKNNAKTYIESQSLSNKQNINLGKDKFNLNEFNKVFEENKIADPTDTGYDEWLKDDKNVKEPPKVFSKKFNIDVFNSTFENWKDEDENLHREIVLRDEPSALVSFNGKTGFSELGVDRVDDFSNSDRGLGYTDLKQAYSKNGIINAKAIKPRESYRSIQEYEKARANINYTMTEEDIRKEAIRKKREQEEEEKRVQRVQNRDNQAFNSYNRVHQMMLDKLK
jgi:curved DNA-binding protein CbpA